MTTSTEAPFTPGGKVLAYTPTFGRRAERFPDTLRAMRGTAGMWFDWLACAGRPTPAGQAAMEALLQEPGGLGLQALTIWPENRGQHHTTAIAFEFARAYGYEWLVRIDDDIAPKTKRWLALLLEQMEEIRTLAKDPLYRIVGGPTIKGLRNQIPVSAYVNKGQTYKVELVPTLGGGVRIHNVKFFSDFKVDLFRPVGRGDPDEVGEYLEQRDGVFMRFPSVRVSHHTDVLESEDTPEERIEREAGHFWPYLGPVEAL